MSRRKKDVIDDVEDVANDCEVIDLPEVTEWLQTGCTLLDLAVANRFPGGLPIGRIVQVFGGNSTCKSLFAYTIMGYAQRAGMETYYDDVENSMNPEFAESCGFDLNHPDFHLGTSANLGEFFDGFLKGAVDSKSGKSKLVIVDSLTALPAKIEQDKKMDEQGFGAYRAKQIHQGLRTWNRRMAEAGVTLLCVDQTRDNLKSAFGGETTVGGKGLEFWSSVRIHLKHKTIIKNSKDVAIGTWVDCVAKKTRFGPPFRGGRFRLQFDYGLDDISTNLALLAKCQGKSDADCMKLMTKVAFKGEEFSIKKWVPLIEDQGLEEELRQAVWAAWQELHKAPERKKRVW
jgi:recombination protein RecA